MNKSENGVMLNTEHGDEEKAVGGEILRTVVGSGVHGIAIEGTDDHDEMGVFIAPQRDVLGFRESRDNYVWRTQPEGARSGPGDTDLIIYNLKKFLRLAVKGNPTVLVPLFAPEAAVLKEHELGKELRAIRTSFLSKEAGERFLGYMHGQHERMLGQSNRNVPNRPELVEKYGYDVKYASHALRLAVQGYEIISQGTLTLPMPPRDRELVLQVKYGEVQKDVVSKWISELEAMCRKKLDENNTPLPKTADIELITDWAVDAQTRFWAES